MDLKEARKRFDEKWTPEPNSGCWLWHGATVPNGYGQFRFGGDPLPAHRVAWLLYVGEIPEGEGHHGMCVLHKCDVRSCVNPDHLFLGSHQDNMDDMWSKGRGGGGKWQRAKTHCKNGHPFNEENMLLESGNRRRCKTCSNERRKKMYERRKDEPIINDDPSVTHCVHGHEYTPENTRRSPIGRRYCRICYEIRCEKRNAQRRAARAS